MDMNRLQRLLRFEAAAVAQWDALSPTEQAAYALTRPRSAFAELADGVLEQNHWWDKLSKKEQDQYIKEHPESKYSHMPRKGMEQKKPEDLRAPQAPQSPRPLPPQERPMIPPHTDENKPKAELPSASLADAPEDREHWPEHIKALKLPPAWQHVRISHDPDSALQAIGKDAKGRSQYVYSEKFAASQAAMKFARIHELDAKAHDIQNQNDGNRKSKDPVVASHADCMHLIMEMGVRPGSEDDTGAEKQAYGATTLQGQHVVNEGGKVFLRFTGKKGVDLNLPVHNPKLAKMLEQRAANAGVTGQLFPHVSDGSLRDYTHKLDGGGFKTKDFRTLKGTTTARKMLETMDAPKTMNEYKKAVHAVAKHVAAHLGNTPAVALQSYISPTVFSGWKAGLDADHEQKSETSAETATKAADGTISAIKHKGTLYHMNGKDHFDIANSLMSKHNAKEEDMSFGYYHARRNTEHDFINADYTEDKSPASTNIVNLNQRKSNHRSTPAVHIHYHPPKNATAALSSAVALLRGRSLRSIETSLQRDGALAALTSAMHMIQTAIDASQHLPYRVNALRQVMHKLQNMILSIHEQHPGSGGYTIDASDALASTRPSKANVQSTSYVMPWRPNKKTNMTQHHIGPYEKPHSQMVTNKKSPNHHYISLVETRKEHRGKGYAHAIMKHITKWADTNGHKLSLHADSDKAKDQNQLEAFYHKHGFVGDGQYMVRHPKVTK